MDSDRISTRCKTDVYGLVILCVIIHFICGDVKRVTIDAAYVFTLNEEPHWRVYDNVVYPV